MLEFTNHPVLAETSEVFDPCERASATTTYSGQTPFLPLHVYVCCCCGGGGDGGGAAAAVYKAHGSEALCREVV